MKSVSRRHFVKTAAAGIAAPTIIPSSVLGVNAPSNKITVGFIGVGGHGSHWNLPSYLEQQDAHVRVVCDVDDTHLNRAKKTVDLQYGNEDCATTKDFREVLERDDIDAVMISTPDHWHTLMSVMALRAGKDVQCEKPTLTIDEGKLLIDDRAQAQEGVPDQHRGPRRAGLSPHGGAGAQRAHRQAAEASR